MNDELIAKIRDLQLKAAFKQAAIESCNGHIWITDYASYIVGGTGSCVCKRCGERRSWKDAQGDGIGNCYE